MLLILCLLFIVSWVLGFLDKAQKMVFTAFYINFYLNILNHRLVSIFLSYKIVQLY